MSPKIERSSCCESRSTGFSECTKTPRASSAMRSSSGGKPRTFSKSAFSCGLIGRLIGAICERPAASVGGAVEEPPVEKSKVTPGWIRLNAMERSSRSAVVVEEPADTIFPETASRALNSGSVAGASAAGGACEGEVDVAAIAIAIETRVASVVTGSLPAPGAAGMRARCGRAGDRRRRRRSRSRSATPRSRSRSSPDRPPAPRGDPPPR